MKSLLEIQTEHLQAAGHSVAKKTSQEINDMYNRSLLTDALIQKGYKKSDLNKLSLDKLRQEQKAPLATLEKIKAEDISQSLLFDVLG